MVRKAKVDKDTWEDFIVQVPLPVGVVPICGLCGNTGEIVVTDRKTPNGTACPPVSGYCICPNGRASKFHKRQEREQP